MTATDGTLMKTQIFCFSDGSKDTQSAVYPPKSSSATSQDLRIERNGVLCLTSHTSFSSGSDASGNVVNSSTEVMMDAAGNVLATVVTTSIPALKSATQTITCPGQSPEPFSYTCLAGGIFSCKMGTCM